MPTTFSHISQVEPAEPASWSRSVFLTLDIDWVCDEVLADAIDLIEKADRAATWFVTHQTPLLDRLRENPNFELGIHPNFNVLLNGEAGKARNAEEVIEGLLDIVPEARSVRSHSLAQSSYILQMFVRRGLTHDCNHFIPEQSGIELKPWRQWDGLVKVPHFWADDAVCLYSQNTPVGELVARPGVKVFCFHPIHVFLNSDVMERYERTREIHRTPAELMKHRHPGNGSRTVLETLLGLS